MEQVILLNSDFSFLDLVSWKKAMKLMFKEKVEVVKNTTKKVMDMYVPQVIKLIKFVRVVYKKSVPLSKRNVFIRDNYTCQYCGKVFSKHTKSLTIDHVIPKVRNGKNTWDNCVASCKQCNTKKGSRTPSEVGYTLAKRLTKPTINEFMGKKLNSLGIKSVLDDIFESMV